MRLSKINGMDHQADVEPTPEKLVDSRGTILFHRDYRRLTGGHLKVWHYLCHAAASRSFRPRLYLTPDSSRNGGNIFLSQKVWLAEEWRPEQADALFVAGMDWLAVPGDISRPILNLIQGITHAQSGNHRREFLRRRHYGSASAAR